MKRVLKVFYGALLSLVMLFSFASCGEEEEKTSSMKCAPCTVSEIYTWNEDVFQEFFYLRISASSIATNAVQCTVNGEEWTMVQQIMDDLPEGKYTIVFYTPEDFTINVSQIVEGEWVTKEVPYVRKVTVKVEISSKYADICDYEYREANGLWVNPTTQDWYKDCQAELEEMYK
ncbi:MAG: hypothetical protein IJ506_08105 [Clostridia bacterium]|nr:hypothetical protein [Clostridia bacterium]